MHGKMPRKRSGALVNQESRLAKNCSAGCEHFFLYRQIEIHRYIDKHIHTCIHSVASWYGGIW